ncbi:early endosome antigen 1-like [Channa argus]|uniref:early endosome antigen 1-like n=1 Tax=Channa argus TaxID=215402 RepID=UPI003520CA0A
MFGRQVPTPPEEEVWSLNAWQHEDDLQNQVNILVQEIEKLKSEKTAACYEVKREKDNAHRLEAALEAKDREFSAERHRLNETIKLHETNVSDLKHRLQLEEEKGKVREREYKEGLDSIGRQLMEGLNNWDIWKEYQAKIKELAKLLDRSETRNQKLSRQLKTKDAENNKNKENWQKTCTSLLEERRKLLENEWTCAKTMNQMEEEMKTLQKDNDRLVEEMNKVDKDKNTLAEEKTNLEKENAHLKEEKTNLEQENAQLQKEKTDLLKVKNKLEVENKNLVDHEKNLQEEMAELAEDKKKRGEYITELEALCMKMLKKREGLLFHRHNEVDTVAAALEKERSKREKEIKLKEKQEKEVQRKNQRERTGFWHRRHAKDKCDAEEAVLMFSPFQ